MSALLPSTPPIDRQAPRRRPSQWALMRQRWLHLLFLHWEVPVAAVRRLVPEPLALDLFDGRCFVGLVPFTIRGVRPPWGPAVPGLSSFHEVNLRTYVHLGGRDPGVWFFSLDASSALAVRAARAGYRLPYHSAAIDFQVQEGPESYHFASRRRAGGALCVADWAPVTDAVGGPARATEPGTLDFFLVERYVLYAGSSQSLWHARVHHPPYELEEAGVLGVEQTLFQAAGLPVPRGEPLVHFSPGVDVEVFAPRKCRP